MCGIVGYIGDKETKKILLDGLCELEYRGYDSAGIAVMQDGDVSLFKAVGKLSNLIAISENFSTTGFAVGIGHTRWATHGKPTETNAHPHIGANSFVVHNGIIENYAALKEELTKDGVSFVSQTDTEVIGHLFEKNLKITGDSLSALKQTQDELHGAYAALIITKGEPNKIFFMKKGSPPLLIGTSKDEKEVYFASSESVLIGQADGAIFLKENEYGYVCNDEINIFDANGALTPQIKKIEGIKALSQKEGFRYFMEKEIYEQSTVLIDTMMGRVSADGVTLEELGALGDLSRFREIKICACGTSYHAAIVASYLFERNSKIRASAEIASEFRYKEPYLSSDMLFVVISQSGETADTLEALKIAKNAGLTTLAICNVDNSTIVRESDATILTRAGIEKGVASTKAFATQALVFWMASIVFGKIRGAISDEFIKREIEAILTAKDAIAVDSSMHEKLKRLSKRYLHGHGFFFIGRDIFYPLALEGALKLKEITYLHAEGYPAGEMKHGPIALADSGLFTIALAPKTLLYDKTKSNIEELSARDSTIAIVSPIALDIADDFIKTKEWNHYMLEFFEMMVVVQILSLEVAVRLGNDVDMPRNLAKSVTVE
ncbi:MAG TPA: glutamine--fructose-6-phosphate transaminase (isomerizing) [Campylobacterales bacterium]|nr:glutamine--fructose-6-phosphate transaminase (isomerizing) [Campylobacterales bacterium]